jgi:hypothetical protein
LSGVLTKAENVQRSTSNPPAAATARQARNVQLIPGIHCAAWIYGYNWPHEEDYFHE